MRYIIAGLIGLVGFLYGLGALAFYAASRVWKDIFD